MRLKELEKVAADGNYNSAHSAEQKSNILKNPLFLGTAGLAGLGGAALASKMPINKVLPLNALGAMTRGAFKGVTKGVGHVAKRRPVGTAAGVAGAAVIAPSVDRKIGPDAYENRINNPIPSKNRQASEFGKEKFLGAESLFKSAEYRPYKEIEKVAVAGFAKRKGKDAWNLLKKLNPAQSQAGAKSAQKGKSYSHREEYVDGMKDLRKMVFPGLIGTTVGVVAAPALQTVGKKFQNRFFDNKDIVSENEEIAKMEAKYRGDKRVSQLKNEYEKKHGLPVFQKTYNSLLKSDPLLSRAAKDNQLKPILDQTASSVYNFAPDLAKDKRSMQALLSEAVTSPEGGLSFQTIKSISETQKAINGARS